MAAKFLIVEDNPADVELVRIQLTEVMPSVEILACDSIARARQALKDNVVELIIADLGLPDAHGVEVVTAIREVAPVEPLIVLTGNDNLSVARNAVARGADDFVVKGNLVSSDLWRSVVLAIARRENARLEDTEISLNHLEKFSHFVNKSRQGIFERLEGLTTSLQQVETAVASAGESLGDQQSSEVHDEMNAAKSAVSDARQECAALMRELSNADPLTSLGPLEKLDADTFLIDVVEPFPDVDVSLPHEDLQLQGEPGLLMAALRGVVRNAIEAGAETVSISVTRSFDRASISVEDDGPGLDTIALSHIFDPFYTTKEGHAGLGLTVARRVVLEHRGTIEAASNPGQGTTVTITLPLAGLRSLGDESSFLP